MFRLATSLSYPPGIRRPSEEGFASYDSGLIWFSRRLPFQSYQAGDASCDGSLISGSLRVNVLPLPD